MTGSIGAVGVSTSDAGGPVTISVARKVVPGREADYEAWVRGITAEAVTFPGHMGVNVITPTPPSREYVTIFRFDTYEHLVAWKDSAVRADWLERLEGIVEGESREQKGTGLEFWFSLPELPVSHPSPHKMALVLLVVVYVIVLLLHALLTPLTEQWAYPVRTLLSVFLQVMLMTYLVMPRGDGSAEALAVQISTVFGRTRPGRHILSDSLPESVIRSLIKP